MNGKLKEYGAITAGTLLMAVGIYFFKFPNNFSTGGVSGIATVLGEIFRSVSKGTIVTSVNIALLLIGFAVFGREFAFKTVYSSLLLSFAINLFEWIIPMNTPFTNQKFMELIISVGLCAFGSAVVFSQLASTGGTDIVAMILKKYTTVDIGKALFLSDAVIALSAWVVFDAETGLLSVFGLIIKAFFVDNIIDGINESKCVTIITKNADMICEYINNTLKRGATVFDCSGSYTNDSKKMVLAVLGRSEAALLKSFMQSRDKGAFMIINSSANIIGKGFRTSIN